MTPKRRMLLTIAAACAALPAFGAANDTVTVTVTGELRQPVHFGIDAERLWFFWPERREQLAEMAVGRLKVDFARVAINGAYEQEEGVTNISAYSDVIIPMMKTFRKYNPNLRFFASPRPMKEVYNSKADAKWLADNFKNGNIGMAA